MTLVPGPPAGCRRHRRRRALAQRAAVGPPPPRAAIRWDHARAPAVPSLVGMCRLLWSWLDQPPRARAGDMNGAGLCPAPEEGGLLFGLPSKRLSFNEVRRASWIAYRWARGVYDSLSIF